MKWLFTILFMLLLLSTKAQQALPTIFYQKNVSIDRNVLIAEDKTGKADLKTVLMSLPFKINNQNTVNLGVSSSTFWIKFSVLNKSNENQLLLDVSQPNIDKLTLYALDSLGNAMVQPLGNNYVFSKRNYNSQDFIFDINIPGNQSKNFLLQLSSSTQILLPIQIGSKQSILEYTAKKDLIFGLFFGIVCAMFFYNLFILFTVRDPIYIYYVVYILILTLTQCTLQGYAFKYFWPNSTWLAQNGVFLFTNLGGIAAAIFTKKFLHARLYAPKLNSVFNLIIWLFVVSIVLVFLNKKQLAFTIMQNSTLLGSVLALIIAIVIVRRGYTPAKFFLLAWISLLLGASIFVLKDYGVFPINVFTSNTIEFGFALEVILLSFALADKINTYKKEKEESQAEALQMSQENQRIIQEQNITLEKEVKQRTAELEKTLRHLKDTQVQLVESEKMSSLGQLTAGIAHEINNPINFVKSNVSPLHMDVQDLFQLITEYQQLHSTSDDDLLSKLSGIKKLENKLDPDFLKEEIESLIGGIEEGAERTAEIVRGLRIFSRLDESEMKEVNIYDNINSTLILLRNATPHYLKIRKHYEAPGEIECYPGKLNQVFMNILTNGIQAIKAKLVKNEEEYIDIWVTEEDECMCIGISDTGIGMTEEVKHKVFDPFFTTKDVGEGTGLGMSIVFKIIEKHHGKIDVVTSPGKGATFTIEIPYKLKLVAAALTEEQAQLFEE